MCVQSCRCKCVREEGRGTARSCKGNCRKPQMSSSARGKLKLKLKPMLKLQLQLQLQLTPELRFDLKLWQRCLLLLHPVTAAGRILLGSFLVAPSKWTFIFLRRRQMAQPKSAKLYNQFAAWQTGDKTDRDRERQGRGWKREGGRGGKGATLELKFWMRRTNEMAQSIRSCHNASYERRERAGKRRKGGE